MIEVIAEHSVDLSLLPKNAVILDGGCRGFGFTDYFRDRGHNVLAIDIDTLDRQDYRKVGVSLKQGIAKINYTNDPQATSINEVESIEVKEFHERELTNNEVYVCDIKGFERAMGINQFDLIKLDIEGDEYDILKYSTHPMAKQLSIEFHAHCGKQTKEQLDELLTELSQYYNITASWESRHGAGFNYWDVLLISKT
jgi:FkbM family methyltransferase